MSGRAGARLREHSSIRLAIVLASQDADKRRTILRAEGGWKGSTLYGYLFHGDDETYKLNFRVTRKTFCMVTEKLKTAGYIVDNICRDESKRVTADYKV